MANKPQRDLLFTRLNYAPSPEQASMHDSTARLKLVVGGERGGKSLSAAMEYMGRFWETPLLWLVAADYERTKPEFNYICESLTKLGVKFAASKNVDPGEILIEGGMRVVTKSAKDPRRLASEAPDGVLGCEASQLQYEDFLRLRGRLAEKRGWMLLSGTFETSLGWYPQLYERGQVPNELELVSFSLPTWSNKAIFPGGRNDPEILALEVATSPEWFLERFGGVPCPPKGLVFNEFRTDLHTGAGKEYEFDASYPVYIWVDPGYAHYYAVEAAQKKGDDVYIIDELYHKNLTTSQIIVALHQKPWAPFVVGGAIDIAATQHQAMPAPAEIWANEGHIALRSRKVRIQDGIERFKSCLKINPISGRSQIHINTRCKGLLSELGGCPNPDDGHTRVYQWRLNRDGDILKDVPEDKNNDGCKAVCYGLVDLLGYSHRTAVVKYAYF